MAAKKKAAKAGVAAAAPYVQRVVSDEELRDNVRVAVESAREAFARLQKSKGVHTTVLDDKRFHKDVSKAAVALKDASDALRESPKRKRKGGLMRKLLFVMVAGGIALAVSEDLRNKVLDALFGKEEEFDYTSSTQPSTPAPAPAGTAS
ncbi:MAG TPA: hypothetical protein VF196_04475 [Casimicrobiaceae bacterium]